MSDIQPIPPPDGSLEKPVPLPPPSAKTLQSWLPLYLKKTDRVIDRLSEILSTRAGTDSLLLTLCYTSLLTSNLLSRISLHKLHQAARAVIEKAVSLPPNTTVLIDTSAIPTSRLLVTARRLKALSALISDCRMFARLCGLVGIWKWGKRTLQNPPEDPLLRTISYAQVLVNTFFQILENGAYLSSKGILGWSKESQGKAWLWSSRFWMAHVGMDLIRLYHEYAARKYKQSGSGKVEVADQEESQWRMRWRKELVVDLAYAPLTVHWSLEKGLVGELWVGVLGSVAGLSGLRVLWKATGNS